MKNWKELFFDLLSTCDCYEEIIDNLRSLETCKTITSEEYDNILKNYDKLVKEWKEEEQR